MQMKMSIIRLQTKLVK